MPPNPTPRADTTALAWLKSLQTSDKCYVRIEDGVAMVRHGNFWRLRQQEIPEELIQPMVSKADSLSLMDYANFVAALTPVQAATLLDPKPVVLGFSLDPVEYCLPALRFLGSLSTLPANNAPLAYGSLSSTQQALFNETLLESGFTGGNWTGAGPGFDPKQYAFLIRQYPVTVNGRVVPGVSLFFGSSTQNGVAFNVPLTP